MSKHLRRLKFKVPVWMPFVAVALLTMASFPFTHSLAGPKEKMDLLPGNFDLRVNGGEALNALVQEKVSATLRTAQLRVNTMELAVNQLRSRVPSAEVSFSTLTGSAEVVENKAGTLTAADPDRDGKTIVSDFLRENADVFGIRRDEVDQLDFIGESVNPEDGLRMVRFQQVVNGLPVFQSETRAIIDRDGRLFRTLGLLVSDSDQAEPLDNLMSAPEALVAAMNTVGIELEPSVMTSDKVGKRKVLVNANSRRIRDVATSQLVYFPVAPGILIPAWSQITFTRGDRDWYTLVDARTGALLWRKNMRQDASTQQARFRVYVQADGVTPADSPAPHSPTTNTVGTGAQYAEISPSIVNMLTAQTTTASPNGWIPDGGTTTTGNNADAYLDRVQGSGETNVPDIGALDNNGRPIGNPDANTNNRDFLGTSLRDFETTYLPPPQGGNPESGQTATGVGTPFDTFRRAAVAQLFYTANWYHDRLFSLGFNEAAGNFQTINFSGMIRLRPRRKMALPLVTAISQRRRTERPGVCRCLSLPVQSSIAMVAWMPCL